MLLTVGLFSFLQTTVCSQKEGGEATAGGNIQVMEGICIKDR